MQRRFTFPSQNLLCVAAAFLLSILLVACASVPEQLTQAAFEGSTASLDGLLKSGTSEINMPVSLKIPQPACPGLKTLTPLQAAACAGQETVVRKLLASKADIDLAAGAGQTPLMLAMAYGRDNVARVLIESGARLEHADAAGNTPLLIAAQRGNKDLAELLLKNGASSKALNKTGDTALLLSTDVSLSKMLAGLGSDPRAVNANGDSGLHQAARNGNAQTARFFLDHGVDVGLKNREGATALSLARTSVETVENGRAAFIAKRRGMPTGASGRVAAAGRTGDRAEVIAAIEEWIDRSVKMEIAAADQVAQQGNSAEALALYVAALTKASDIGGNTENDLRVKIVQYAAGLPQPPGLPEKAREHLVRSSYLLKKGQDVSLVENEMLAALCFAPWWAEGYYNLGQLQFEQGKFDAAERNLKLFINAARGDSRAQAAQDKIYEIKLAREEEGKIRGMQGRWVDAAGRSYTTTIGGDKILLRSDNGLSFTLTQKNGVLDGSVEGGSYAGEHRCTIPAQMHPVSGRLAADARSMTLEYLWSRYKTSYHCVNMMGIPSNCCLLCDTVCDAVTVSGTDRVNLQLKPAK